MSSRISIGSTYADTWLIVCWIFGGIFALLALILFAVSVGDPRKNFSTACVVWGSLGAVFLTFAVIRSLGIASRRRWLQATKSGFILEDRRGEFQFDDEVITDLGTWAKVRFSNGTPKAVTRTGALFVQTEEFASRLEFQYEWGLNQEDPLGPFVERNLNRLTELAEANLIRGREVSGDDWILDQDGLTYADQSEERTVPLAKLSAVDIVDGKVCVWRVGQDAPVVKVPSPSPNALILYRILLKKLEGNAAQENEEADGLGRLIFERDKSLTTTMIVLILILGAIFALVGIGLVVSAFSGRKTEFGPIIAGLVLVLLAVGIVFAGFFYRVNIFRCHAFGVSRTTARGEASMRFKDVRIFTYSAVRNYYNGSYTGTAINMKFEALRGEKITYNATFKNADDELDNLREHVSRVIASHMLKKLKDGKTVEWTDRVRFTPEGLEVAGRSGLFGRSDDLFVPYEEVADLTLNAGNFALLVEGRKKPVYETTVATPNFFPGYVLMILIRFTPDESLQKSRRPDDNEPEDYRKIQ